MQKRFLVLVLLMTTAITCGWLYSLSLGTGFEDYLYRRQTIQRLLMATVCAYMLYFVSVAILRRDDQHPVRFVRLLGAAAMALNCALLGLTFYVPRVTWPN